MKIILFALLVGLAACSSSQYHELAHTSKDDPIWQLNQGKWDFHENNLTQAGPVYP